MILGAFSQLAHVVRSRPILFGSGTLGVATAAGWSSSCQESNARLLEEEEKKLLSRIKISRVEQQHVVIDDKDTAINTIMATRLESIPASPKVLVMLHGWGAGSALFAKNIDQLTSVFDVVYAIDLIGFGRSSRPAFPRKKISVKKQAAKKETDRLIVNIDIDKFDFESTITDPEAAEVATSFFIEAIESWRKRVIPHVDNMCLLGHSFGGFLACSYALRHPEVSLSSLILCAPVGIAPWRIERNSTARHMIARGIWEMGATPQSLLRAISPFADRVWSWLGERANYRGLDALAWKYLLHCQLAPGSGDVAFMQVLQPDGWAMPLLPAFPNLVVPRLRIIYGDRDYVRPEFAPFILDAATSISPAKKDYVVLDAGHHMYYGESENAFNAAIQQVAEEVYS